MNSKRWQDHFQQEFRALEASLGGADSLNTPSSILLNQALEKAILPEDKYFSWAQNEHQLPLLKQAFFADHPVDGKIWKKFQDAYPWDPNFLPIAEWEGHLLVACLEPKRLPQTLQAIYILCPLSGLKQLWQAYQHAAEFQLSDSSPAAEDEPLLETTDTPEGLALHSDLNATPEFDGLLSSTPLQVRLEKTVIAPQERETVIRETTPPAKTIPPPPREQILPTAPLVGTKSPPVVSQGREIYVLEILQKDKPQIFAKQIQQAFVQMKESFDRSLLLSCDTKNQFVRPVAGDESFVNKPEIKGTTLAEASIFSIVEKTQKPFHGPISLNEINEKFFEDWNKGQIPTHVTIVPLINNDTVIGMLMGIGETTAYNKPTLHAVEKTAQDFLAPLIPSKQTRTAA